MAIKREMVVNWGATLKHDTACALWNSSEKGKIVVAFPGSSQMIYSQLQEFIRSLALPILECLCPLVHTHEIRSPIKLRPMGMYEKLET